jgi:hypothetical protein
MIQNVARVDWNFTAASWGIDDELRNGVTSSVTPKTFDDFDPFGDRGPKMSRSVNKIALINVIRADTAHDQLVYQSPHHGQVVVDPFQEDALISERYSVINQKFKSGLYLGGEFTRMIGMDAHPKRVKFLKHPAEFRCNPLGQENGNPGANSDELNMFNGPQTAQNSAQLIVGKEEGISPGKQNVPDLGVRFQIPVSFLEIGVQLLFARPADYAASGAIAAIRRAPIGD